MSKESDRCPFLTKGYNWMGKLVDGCNRHKDYVVACYEQCRLPGWQENHKEENVSR